MICSNCKTKMGRTSIDYRYRASGLDNVVLQKIPAFKCPGCGDIYPIISRIGEIHAEIADRLVKKASIITGKEMAFLRKEMGLKAKDISELFGVHKVTVSRWETGREPIKLHYDRLIRFLYNSQKLQEACKTLQQSMEKMASNQIDPLKHLLRACHMMRAENLFAAPVRRKQHMRPEMISVPFAAIKSRLIQLRSDS